MSVAVPIRRALSAPPGLRLDQVGPGARRRFATGRGEFLNSAEAQQFFDRLIAPPTAERQTLDAAFLNALKADGTYDKLDCLVVCAGAVDTCLINWISDSLHPAIIGSPTFTEDLGVLCAGVNNTISSQWQPSTGGLRYSRNSACIFAWNLTAKATQNSPLWFSVQDINVELWPRYAGGVTLSMANNLIEQSVANPGDTSGFYMTNRTGSGSYRVLRNGVLLNTYPVNSVIPESNTILFGVGNSAPNQFRLGLYGFGESLTPGQEMTIFTAGEAHLTALGVWPL